MGTWERGRTNVPIYLVRGNVGTQTYRRTGVPNFTMEGVMYLRSAVLTLDSFLSFIVNLRIQLELIYWAPTPQLN